MNGIWIFAAVTTAWAYGCLIWNILGFHLGGVGFWITMTLVAGIVPALLRRSIRPPAAAPKLSAVPLRERLFDVCIALATLVVLVQAVSMPMHAWDSIVLYGFKAKILFWEGTYRTPAFQDPGIYHMNADYPLLIPYLEASFYKLAGHSDDRWIRLLFVAYWIVFLGMIYEGLRFWIRPRVRRAVLALVATLPLFSADFMGQASSGFADIPFAFYWTGFWVALMRRDITLQCGWYAVANVMALGGILTKNEGLPLFFLGWILYSQIRHAHEREALGHAVLLLILVSPWLWVRAHLTHNAVHQLRWPHGPLLEIAAHVRQTAWAWAREMASVRYWGIFWGVVIAALCWPKTGPRFPWTVRLLLAAVGLQVVTYGWATVTASYSLDLLLPITTQRLLIHLIGPVVLAVGARFQEQL